MGLCLFVLPLLQWFIWIAFDVSTKQLEFIILLHEAKLMTIVQCFQPSVIIVVNLETYFFDFSCRFLMFSNKLSKNGDEFITMKSEHPKLGFVSLKNPHCNHQNHSFKISSMRKKVFEIHKWRKDLNSFKDSLMMKAFCRFVLRASKNHFKNGYSCSALHWRSSLN